MLALSTIDYQEMTDNNAINTQNDKEERKIGDKEKRRKYRDSTKSHNTCPKDGKSNNILQHVQHQLIGTNATPVPNSPTGAGTGQITEA